jgi:hypothetical protein
MHRRGPCQDSLGHAHTSQKLMGLVDMILSRSPAGSFGGSIRLFIASPIV